MTDKPDRDATGEAHAAPIPDDAPLPPSIAQRFAHVDTWVFDLDNTLYPIDSDLWPKIDARITLFLAHMFGLDGMSSMALQKYYYRRHDPAGADSRASHLGGRISGIRP